MFSEDAGGRRDGERGGGGGGGVAAAEGVRAGGGEGGGGGGGGGGEGAGLVSIVWEEAIAMGVTPSSEMRALLREAERRRCVCVRACVRVCVRAFA